MVYRFLTISNNKIKKMENLLCLTLLQFLDLSYNQVDQLEEGSKSYVCSIRVFSTRDIGFIGINVVNIPNSLTNFIKISEHH